MTINPQHRDQRQNLECTDEFLNTKNIQSIILDIFKKIVAKAKGVNHN